MDELKAIKLAKLENWKQKQLVLYPDAFSRTHNAKEALAMDDGTEIKIAGRLMLRRTMGKICFGQLKDFNGVLQIALKADVLHDELFDFYTKNLDIGDFIGVSGKLFTTQKGEKTLNVEQLTLLSKSIIALPEKWHGLADEEKKLRQRYLDLLMNKETMQVFQKRHKIIGTIKKFLDLHEFIEVETPILQKQASGALATPFATHHKALDIPLFLRIAPETYLKRLIVGGYERIFELGKSFRNEGVDSSHLQEFTMLEFYAVYWNYKDAMAFVQNLFQNLFAQLKLDYNLEYVGKKIDCTFPWKEITYQDLVYKYTNLDLENLLKDEAALHIALGKFINIREYKSTASMIDAVYKKHCRPHLINPTIITNQPAILGPLARVNDFNKLWSDRFQIVIDGLEVVNSYSELVDPIAQRETLEMQKQLTKQGEEEAMEMEDDFLLAMEYGMPPMAGVGIGIDRIVALFTDSSSLRDVVFFPSLR